MMPEDSPLLLPRLEEERTYCARNRSKPPAFHRVRTAELEVSRLALEAVKPAAERERPCSRDSSVAAGVVLCGNQDQAWAGRFRLLFAAEGVQEADDGGISGENAQANRGNDCGEEEDGHE